MGGPPLAPLAPRDPLEAPAELLGVVLGPPLPSVSVASLEVSEEVVDGRNRSSRANGLILGVATGDGTWAAPSKISSSMRGLGSDSVASTLSCWEAREDNHSSSDGAVVGVETSVKLEEDSIGGGRRRDENVFESEREESWEESSRSTQRSWMGAIESKPDGMKIASRSSTSGACANGNRSGSDR